MNKEHFGKEKLNGLKHEQYHNLRIILTKKQDK